MGPRGTLEAKNCFQRQMEMGGSALEEESSFKMLGLNFFSYIISISETASKKIGAFIRSMKFLSPEVARYLYKSTIRPCMAPLVATKNCQASYKYKYATLLVIHLLLLLNPWLIYRYYFSRGSSELAQLVALPFSRERSCRCSDRDSGILYL